jgi:multidrug efflux pump subunit AcrA (membrane-fusion protein)
MLLSRYLIAIALLSFSLSCNRQPVIQAKQDTGPLAVRVAPVTGRQIQRTVETSGTMFPFDEAIISAEIEGRLDEIKADLGDKVTKGQLLVHINDEEQRYKLLENEAQLHQSLERLGLKNEKDRVKDIKDTPDARKAQADVFDAEQRYKRTHKLVEQGVASQADLDQATAKFKAAQAAYDATMYATRNLIQDVERTRALLDLQRKKLRDTSVVAPFNGLVKDRQAVLGAYVILGAPLLTLVRIDPIRLRLEIPERMAPWIRQDQTVQVWVEAFGDRTFTGKLWRISPTVDQSKRTFIAEALIENSRGELKPGSYAHAHIPSNKVDRVKIIPFRSVNYVLGSNKAYVVKGDAIEAREVKLGDRFEEEVEIVSGLEEGEQVATTQVTRLDTGVKVKISTGGEEKKDRKKAE